MYGLSQTNATPGTNGFCYAEKKAAPVIHFPKKGQVQCRNCGTFEACLGSPIKTPELVG